MLAVILVLMVGAIRLVGSNANKDRGREHRFLGYSEHWVSIARSHPGFEDHSVCSERFRKFSILFHSSRTSQNSVLNRFALF